MLDYDIGICSIATTLAIIFLMRWYFQGGQFQQAITAYKVVLITGCSNGIGKETALELARRGAKVYMACPCSKSCEAARQEIIHKTENFNVVNYELNLESFQSITSFVKRFTTEQVQLDVLINNAGICPSSYKILTEDGVEKTFAANYLGHFLLTNLLLDTLKASAPSKIINVSNHGHRFGVIDPTNLNSEKHYAKWNAYNTSKLAMVLFTRELAARLKNTTVTVNALHPGFVRSDFLGNSTLSMKFCMLVYWLFFKTPKSGAQTTIALTLDSAFDTVSGKYFSDCKIARESISAEDDQMSKWLWEYSEHLTNLKHL